MVTSWKYNKHSIGNLVKMFFIKVTQRYDLSWLWSIKLNFVERIRKDNPKLSILKAISNDVNKQQQIIRMVMNSNISHHQDKDSEDDEYDCVPVLRQKLLERGNTLFRQK
jgi:hypothetical protein